MSDDQSNAERAATRPPSRDAVAARLAEPPEGLPDGWIARSGSLAQVGIPEPTPTGQIDWDSGDPPEGVTADLYIYGPRRAFDANGDFDPATIADGTPFLMGAIFAPGLGEQDASSVPQVGVRVELIESSDYDLVVACAASFPEVDVNEFVSSITDD